MSAARSITPLLTLKASADFQRIAREGRKWTGSAFTMLAVKKDASVPGETVRIGFTVSRRVGNAVVRNRAKRRLREIVRQSLKENKISACDMVLIARTSAATRDFQALCLDFMQGLTHLGIAA